MSRRLKIGHRKLTSTRISVCVCVLFGEELNFLAPAAARKSMIDMFAFFKYSLRRFGCQTKEQREIIMTARAKLHATTF